LKLPIVDDAVAIDIHTHAEELCGMHGDDRYDDFQAQLAAYFNSPHEHPPTAAAYCRIKKIVARDDIGPKVLRANARKLLRI
jgi:hypothetical protein